jgi:hypothetical protein
MSAVEFPFALRGAHIGDESRITKSWHRMALVILLISAVLVTSVVLAIATGTDYGDAPFLLG